MKRTLPLALCALLCAGCVVHRKPSLPEPIPLVTGKPRALLALRTIDIALGKGALAEPRKCLYVQYTGWLTNGKKFDSSRDPMPNGAPRDPYGFPQGLRRVIGGWDFGFEGMRVGGQRRLFVPYQLAYGEAGRPPSIPPRSELIFDVELMAVADTLPRAPVACPPWSELKR
jgi:peptidylprolyl isomerase